MSLLLGNIDADTIHLIRGLFSDKMLQYLHIIMRLLMKGQYSTMVTTGEYTLIPATNILPVYVGENYA